MSFFYFDVENFPLIILTIQGHPQNMEDMNKFLTTWQTLYTRSMNENKPYKLLFDVRQAVLTMEATKYMNRLAEWLGTMRPLAEKWMDRTAILCQSNTVKIFLKILFRLYPPAKPYKIFQENELKRAMKWIYSSDSGDTAIDTGSNSETLPIELQEFSKL